MKMVRTTIRIEESLKKRADLQAIEDKTSFQAIVNRALEDKLTNTAKKKAKLLILPKFDLGIPLDNLTRDEIYGEPKW